MPLLARLFWLGATSRALPRDWRKIIRKRFARHRPGPYDAVIQDLKFRLYPSENHTDRIIAGRRELPEIPERKLLSPLVTGDIRFVDIGGNIGLYALWVARDAGPDARVISFEPHPRTFQKLAYNCRINGHGNIEILNVGIGPADEDTTLFSDGGGNIGGASMLREASGDKVATSIHIRPLADLLRQHEFARVDLLKIDIEGFEDRALMPFLSDASNEPLFPKSILLETVHQHLWNDDLIGMLTSLGYREIGSTEENLLLGR